VRADTRYKSSPNSAASTARKKDEATAASFTVGRSAGGGMQQKKPQMFDFKALFAPRDQGGANDAPKLPMSAPPAVPFSALPPPPLPSRMPFHAHFDPSEMKVGTRLGIVRSADVGLVLGDDDGDVVVSRATGQAGRKGIFKGDVVSAFDGVTLDKNIDAAGLTLVYNELCAKRELFSITVNCDDAVARELSERARDMMTMSEL
jgi:hypothetical protein